MLVDMKCRPAELGRLATLAIVLAFGGSLVLPCLCMPAGPTSHAHCGETEGGVRIAASSCCCARAMPGPSEVTATKVTPTPAPALLAVGVLPDSLMVLPSVLAAPAARRSHAPPASLILRI